MNLAVSVISLGHTLIYLHISIVLVDVCYACGLH
jgi:hypothetical protein